MSETAEPLVRFEERKSKRVTTFKKGKVIFNNGHSVLECTVRNLSKNGACLQLPCHIELPTVFTLAIEGGEKHQCETVWFANDKVGVKYTSESRSGETESPRRLLLKRIRLIQDQLDALETDVKTVLAP